MKRRDFLKILGVTPVIAVVPSLVNASVSVNPYSKEGLRESRLLYKEIKQSEIDVGPPITTQLLDELKIPHSGLKVGDDLSMGGDSNVYRVTEVNGDDIIITPYQKQNKKQSIKSKSIHCKNWQTFTRRGNRS